MKCSTIAKTLTIGAVAALALGVAPTAKADNKGCSNASLRGAFGFTGIGTLLAVPAPFAGPYAEVGSQTFDGKGNTDGTMTISANGNIMRETIQGTYTINPDCTGSLTLYSSPLGVTAHYDLVIDNDGAELRAICTDPGAVISRVYRAR